MTWTKPSQATILQLSLAFCTLYFLIPFILFFVSAPSFRPWPNNLPMEHMVLAVLASMSLTNAILLLLEPFPSMLHRDFQMSLSITIAGINAYHTANSDENMGGAIAYWSIAGGVLLITRFLVWTEIDGPLCTWPTWIGSETPRTRRETGLSIFFGCASIGLMAGPVFNDWAPVAPFVRWYPLNTFFELIWRGIFFNFALFSFFSAWRPWGTIQKVYPLFMTMQAFIHATVMLLDNIVNTQGNNNIEHLYGDILAWYLFCVAMLTLQDPSSVRILFRCSTPKS